MNLWERTFFNNISGYIAILNKLLSKRFIPEPLSKHIKILGGYAFKSTEYTKSGVPIIRISDFQDEKVVLDKTKFYKESEELSSYELSPNDIIIAMTGGTIGKLAIVQEGLGKIYLNQRVGKFRALNPNAFEPEYIYWLARGIQENIKNLAWGGAQPNVSGKTIEAMEMPFPDKTTQNKIISFLCNLRDNCLKDAIYFDEDCEKEIFSIHSINMNCSALTFEIAHQQTILKKLRQQILQEAIEGKLTADWREQNPDIEPASELLARIKAEKEQLIKDKKIKKQKALPPITDEEKPFDLPDGWVWCRYGDVMLDIEAGKSPTCYNYPARLGEWGVLKISAISWNSFREDENKKLKPNIEPFANKEVKSGDFIMTRANTKELVAKSVIVGNVRQKLLLNDKTLRVDFSRYVSPKYMNLFNNGEHARKHYISVATGASPSMKNISRDNIKILPVPLPPLTEQEHIISKAKRLFAICDQLEVQMTKNQTHAKQLMQAVLKEAFQQNSCEAELECSNEI